MTNDKNERNEQSRNQNENTNDDDMKHDNNDNRSEQLSLDELLTHSLLGETTAEQETRVQTALEGDVDLRAEYEARRESLAMLKEVDQGTATLTLARRDELLRDVAEGPGSGVNNVPVGLSWAAALLAIAGGAIMLAILERNPRGDEPVDVAGAPVAATVETASQDVGASKKFSDRDEEAKKAVTIVHGSDNVPDFSDLREESEASGEESSPALEEVASVATEAAKQWRADYEVNLTVDPNAGASPVYPPEGTPAVPDASSITVNTVYDQAASAVTPQQLENWTPDITLGGDVAGKNEVNGSAQFMNVPSLPSGTATAAPMTTPSSPPVAAQPGAKSTFGDGAKPIVGFRKDGRGRAGGGAGHNALDHRKALQDAYRDQGAAVAARRYAEARRNRALLDAQELGKTDSALARELKDVRQQLEEKANLIAAAEDAGINFDMIFTKGPVAPIDGVVAAVNPDVNLVVISIGAKHAVQHGYEFTIYRGDRFIGKAKVQNVLDDMAGCRILYVEDGEEVRQGDKVSTRIGGGGVASTTPESPTPQSPAPPTETSRLEYEMNLMLDWIRPRAGETPNDMFFRYWGDNPFVDASKDPQSTFGLDVDTASYTLARSYIQDGNIPPKEAIRTEEFVNYFSSNYAAPTDTDLKIYVERAPSRFAHRENVHLIKVGIKARETKGDRGPLALTLVIDVSGSMATDRRLELVKDAIRTLLTALRPDDTIAIVTFQSEAKVELRPTKVAEIDKILTTLTSLVPDGSTNLEGGLQLAYPLAKQQFQSGGSNRVVIFSDGVANVGLTDPEGILNGIAENRKEGIYLDTFGVGMGNHNDHLLEQLADRGDGSCSYVDTLAEATRIFRKNLTGVFVTVAKDAKVQVEFDPKVVLSYRQIGYENRAIADEDFRNDAIDAGEVGAGHEVVALYEVELLADSTESPAVVRLRYQSVGTHTAEGAPEVIELERKVPGRGAAHWEAASERFRLSAGVAAFAEHLRDSYWARSGHLAEVIEEAQGLVGLDTADDKRVREWLQLMLSSVVLINARPKPTDYGRLLEELKKNNYLRKRYEELADKEANSVLEELKKQNERLEEKIRKLRGTPR